jgi:predicted Zn-dependent protease with MMP-like domain
MIDVDEVTFGRLVEDALDSLPTELGQVMRNVAVVVADEGNSPNLLGLYQGVPLTRRSAASYGGVLPDRITIYRLPICRRCASEDEVAARVRTVVIHEIGHHFGIGDKRLRELGWG